MYDMIGYYCSDKGDRDPVPISSRYSMSNKDMHRYTHILLAKAAATGTNRT